MYKGQHSKQLFPIHVIAVTLGFSFRDIHKNSFRTFSLGLGLLPSSRGTMPLRVSRLLNLIHRC